MSVEIGTFEEFVSAAHVNRMGIVSDLIRFNFLYPQQRDATGSFYVNISTYFIETHIWYTYVQKYIYIYINTYMIMVM